MAPHMHALARGFEAWRFDAAGPAEALYLGEGWFDPDTVVFDPPVELAPGDGIGFTCTWENPGDTVVDFGERSDDEMCFAFGFATGMPADLVALGGTGCTLAQ